MMPEGNQDSKSSGIKALGWRAFGMLLAAARRAYAITGKVQKVDTVIYKVDRLGDWLLAEASIERIVSSVRSRGGSVVVWAGKEADAIRQWRPPNYTVETFLLEPSGLVQKVARALAVVRLLARYRMRTLICLRHSPEPIREFVLANAAADEVFALSWRVADGEVGPVPHEIARHQAVLMTAGIGPADTRGLLPFLQRRQDGRQNRAVVAPFSSARIKDWPDRAWADVLRAVVDLGLKAELWVTPAQVPRANEIRRLMPAGSGVDGVSVRSGTLSELRDAVDASALVLTVDTFAAHLATALDVPMVCVLGGGQYGDFGPWKSSERQQWVTHRLPCFGCNWVCSRRRVECLEDIQPAEVISRIKQVLESGKLAEKR